MTDNILKGREDIYRGITIISDNNDVKQEDASDILQRSLQIWKDTNVNGVWFKVYKKDSFWVPILIEYGFDYHHAQKNYVMLTKWLPTHKASTLPSYPFTSIGVGAVVCNNKGQYLLIRERKGIYLGWKFPGGLADPGEDIYETAKRETLEETGIESEFETILTMRHTTSISSYQNVGDMYFVCAMKPTDENKIEIKPCPREIAACQWMTKKEIDDLSPEEFHIFNRSILDAYIHWKESEKKGFYMTKFSIPKFKKTWSIYTID